MSELFQEVELEDQESINPLEELVGDGKKFASVEELARGKKESDRFIKRLESELAELRGAVQQKSSMDEILTQIKALSGNAPPSQSSPNQPPQEPERRDGTPKEDLEAVVASIFEKKQAEQRRTQNAQTVAQKLQSAFGQDANLELNRRAKELGVSLAYLQNLASESPNLFFKAVGISDTPAQPSPPAPRGSIQSPQGAPSGLRNKAYYDKIKAQDPNRYFSQDVQKQMYKDSMAQGASFFS